MPECSRRLCICVVLCLITAWLAPPAWSQSEPFYQGKTLRFVVGSAPANFYDSWARLIARYWGKHIPGNPNVIVQNMPGAGSITRGQLCFWRRQSRRLDRGSAEQQHLHRTTDRTQGGAVRPAQISLARFGVAGLDHVLHARGYAVQNRSAKSSRPNNRPVAAAPEPPARITSWRRFWSWLWARRSIRYRAIKAAATLTWRWKKARSSAARIRWRLISAASRSIPGIRKASTFTCFNPDASAIRARRRRRRCTRSLEEFKVPDAKRRVAQALLSGGEFGRPVLVTPGTPRDRIKILRDSFRNVMKDPDLLAEAKKSRMDVEYTAGEELEALLKEVLTQPPEVIEQARKILGN